MNARGIKNLRYSVFEILFQIELAFEFVTFWLDLKTQKNYYQYKLHVTRQTFKYFNVHYLMYNWN